MTTKSSSTTGRLLGLDIGSRRIGVAVCDELGMVASPWGVVARGNATIETLRGVSQQLGVIGLVAGLPKGLSGQEGKQAADSREFAEELAGALGLPLDYWDERLTSTQAERSLIEAGMSRQKRKESIDSIAASLMLQGYLDNRMHRRQSGRRHSETS